MAPSRVSAGYRLRHHVVDVLGGQSVYDTLPFMSGWLEAL